MSQRYWMGAVAAALMLPGCGCGGSSQMSPSAAKVAMAPPAKQAVEEKAEAPAAGGKPAEPAIERKIIFNGHLDVIVKDFDTAREQLTRKVAEWKGYFAKSEVSGDAGTRRSGTFTLKVPSENFATAVDTIARLGVAVRNSTDSQDVTEEFVDISARVKNLKAEEETLNKLLRDAASRLDDVFKIREQIRTVRGDIERAEGRLKALSALSALSTIVVILREQSDYVPPTVEPPPEFGTRIASTFRASVNVLRTIGEAIVIGLTAAAPWLPFVLVVALLVRWVSRRVARQSVTSAS